MIYKNLAQLIGNTPMLEISFEEGDFAANVFAKLESFNPCGSSKDRIAISMIEDAEKRGLLGKDSCIIEPTSGNTGIALAAVAASKGYRIILTMPETMSVERCKLLAAYGAEIVLTEGKKGMLGAIDKACELAEEISGSFVPGQFENPANPAAHALSTGPEIWRDINGEVDVFVACVGTGGTLTGTGEYLKTQNPDIRIVAVEPASSPLISEGKVGEHKIQGIGADFIPEILNKTIIDEVIPVTDDDAFKMTARFATKHGLLVGISSGAALFAAKALAQRPAYKGKNIVVLLPDSGERYLSIPVFNRD